MTGSRYDDFDVFSRSIVGFEAATKETNISVSIWQQCEIMRHLFVKTNV